MKWITDRELATRAATPCWRARSYGLCPLFFLPSKPRGSVPTAYRGWLPLRKHRTRKRVYPRPHYPPWRLCLGPGIGNPAKCPPPCLHSRARCWKKPTDAEGLAGAFAMPRGTGERLWDLPAIEPGFPAYEARSSRVQHSSRKRRSYSPV